ncbi:MAG: UbiA family prenyltransferase, partial [Methanobacterium paludis]|nr:UbiA family prenyltransferase [Methanobacterium paludis]
MAVTNDPSGKCSKSFANKSKAIWDILRPELPLAGGICVIAGQIIVLQTLPSLFVGVMGFLTGFFISGAAMITNDYFDLDVDRINHPQRPIPSGRISVPEAMVLTGLFSTAGFITSGLLGPIALSFVVFIWTIAILYNWKLKERGLLGNMIVGFSVAGFFIFGGLTVNGLTNGLIWTFGALAFIFDLGEEIAGDAMDMAGDEKRSSRTIARVHGKQYALNVSSFLFTLFAVVSLLPLLMGWLNITYLIIFLPTDFILLYLALKILKSQTVEEGLRRIRQLS